MCSRNGINVPVAQVLWTRLAPHMDMDTLLLGVQELSFQLTALLFSFCKGKSIAAGLFWYCNCVDLIP